MGQFPFVMFPSSWNRNCFLKSSSISILTSHSLLTLQNHIFVGKVKYCVSDNAIWHLAGKPKVLTAMSLQKTPITQRLSNLTAFWDTRFLIKSYLSC